MKKLIKFCIMAVLVMIAIGFLVSAAVSFTKGSDYANRFLVEVTGGKIDGWMERVDDWGEEAKDLLHGIKEDGDELLDNVLNGYDGPEGYDIDDAIIFDSDEAVESGNIDRVFENRNASVLHVEISGCMLEILDSEDGSVRVVAENVGKFQAYQKGNELRITSTRKARENAEDSKITLYLPARYSWQEVDLEVGAGVIRIGGTNASGMTASQMTLEAGAGQIVAEGLKVSELDASVGAGEIRLSGMEVGRLDASAGVGNLVVQGTVTESIKAECSMGNLELKLTGSQTDYDYQLECVAGNIKIGEEQHGGGVAKEQNINNGAGRRIDLECSMGNIAVTFEQ